MTFTKWQYARALAVIGILIFAGCESVTEKCIRAEALIAAYGECATADFKCARAVRIGMYDKEVNQCDAISERE